MIVAGLFHFGGRVGNHKRSVVKLTGVPGRGFDAHVRRNAANDNAAYALVTQYGIEWGSNKGAGPVLVDDDIVPSRREGINDFDVPRAGGEAVRRHRVGQEFADADAGIAVIGSENEARLDDGNLARPCQGDQAAARFDGGPQSRCVKAAADHRPTIIEKRVLHVDDKQCCIMPIEGHCHGVVPLRFPTVAYGAGGG